MIPQPIKYDISSFEAGGYLREIHVEIYVN